MNRPGFAALSVDCAAALAHLPCAVAFRSSIGWPDPEEFARLERRHGVGASDTPEGWNALVAAMADAGADAGERLPAIDSAFLVTARVGRTGALALIEDHTALLFANAASLPMPWQPAAMDEIIAALAGGQDPIAATDRVT